MSTNNKWGALSTRTKSSWNIEEIKNQIKKVTNFTQLLRNLGMNPCGSRLFKIKKICNEHSISYAHFSHPKYIDVQTLLQNKSTDDSSFLRRKLLAAGIKENKCECCGISEWQGKPLAIQLHHIDGNRRNNSLQNLIMLCPNCHSQTDNYCGKKDKARKRYYCADCGKEISHDAIRCKPCYTKYKWKK